MTYTVRWRDSGSTTYDIDMDMEIIVDPKRLKMIDWENFINGTKLLWGLKHVVKSQLNGIGRWPVKLPDKAIFFLTCKIFKSNKYMGCNSLDTYCVKNWSYLFFTLFFVISFEMLT